MIKITAKEMRDGSHINARARVKQGTIYELTSAALKIREIALQWPGEKRECVLAMLADAVKNGIEGCGDRKDEQE